MNDDFMWRLHTATMLTRARPRDGVAALFSLLAEARSDRSDRLEWVLRQLCAMAMFGGLSEEDRAASGLSWSTAVGLAEELVQIDESAASLGTLAILHERAGNDDEARHFRELRAAALERERG